MLKTTTHMLVFFLNCIENRRCTDKHRSALVFTKKKTMTRLYGHNIRYNNTIRTCMHLTFYWIQIRRIIQRVLCPSLWKKLRRFEWFIYYSNIAHDHTESQHKQCCHLMLVPCSIKEFCQMAPPTVMIVKHVFPPCYVSLHLV